MMKLIILDRDGVINHDSDAFIKTPEEWHAIDGSLEAIAALHHAGWTIAIASNQSGISRGLISIEALNAIHGKLIKQLATLGAQVDGIFFCPHTAEVGCDCRKPKAGLLHEIARRFNTSLIGVPLVGDALRDLQAAALVEATPYLVRTGKGEKTLAQGGLPDDTQVFANLASVAQFLLKKPAYLEGANHAHAAT